MRVRIFALLAVLAAGCNSYKDDLQTICESPKHAGIPADANPSQKAMKLAEYIHANVHEGQALRFLQGLASVVPAQRMPTLRAEAARAGLASCPLAEDSDEPGQPK